MIPTPPRTVHALNDVLKFPCLVASTTKKEKKKEAFKEPNSHPGNSDSTTSNKCWASSRDRPSTSSSSNS
ncbi:hypothetical protein E2C01_065804 [Portunus trituberculatus]|uniref:Uncharacterized protein n=1 Tax=Portunus trituberculatus TaxID=210409 RepID=A0A5B7HQL9_PORTR|nr:hypothetical protein [Portunus trituberculatus]